MSYFNPTHLLFNQPHKMSQRGERGEGSDINSHLIEEERISLYGKLECCFCFKEVRDRQTALIVGIAALYYLSVSLTVIPLKLIINQRIAGDSEDPNPRCKLTTSSFFLDFSFFLSLFLDFFLDFFF